MREQYQEELDNFYQMMTKIGNIANEALHKAVKAYDELDKDLANDVINNDSNINKMVIDIEAEAYRLIVLQQPVAIDLRKIFTVLLTSMDIERIADHASAIAKTVIRLDDSKERVEPIRLIINEMAEITQGMLKDALASFHDTDLEKVHEIADRDDEVDALLKKLYEETKVSMSSNTEIVNPGINFLNIGKSIERIGDYTTNICERLIYLETGEMVELNI